MQQQSLDAMIAFAVAELASADARRTGRLVRSLVQQFPQEKALMLCFALTSAAAAVEDVVLHGGTGVSPTLGYKLAALVAADVLAVEALTGRSAMADDLLHFWRRVDPYFLET